MILQGEINHQLMQEIQTVLSYESNRNVWKNKFESKEFKAAERLGLKVGSPLNKSVNCGCIDDLFIVLKLIKKQYKNQKPLENMNKEKNCKFRIKNDGMIQLHGIEPITNDNLTDEKAIELLKLNKKHISNFDIYPDNWEKLIGEDAPKDKKPTENKKTATDVSNEVNDSSAESGEITREEELIAVGEEEGGKDVLKQLANSIFEAGKAPTKPHHNAGVKSLAKYIVEYENK